MKEFGLSISILTAVKRVWSRLHHTDFLVENAYMPISALFVRSLYDMIENEKAFFTYLPVVINLEEVSADSFYSVIMKQLRDIIETRYPSIISAFPNEIEDTVDIIDFVYYVTLFSEDFALHESATRYPLRIVLLIYNAENLDRFGQKFKENLNDLLKGTLFRAVIVAKRLTRRWASKSPHWLGTFQNILLNTREQSFFHE